MQLLTRWYGFSFTYPDCSVFGSGADDVVVRHLARQDCPPSAAALEDDQLGVGCQADLLQGQTGVW